MTSAELYTQFCKQQQADTVFRSMLTSFNIVDVGVITEYNGTTCTVQSTRTLPGQNIPIEYTDVEVILTPGSNSNIFQAYCVVFFPNSAHRFTEDAEDTEDTSSISRNSFSVSGAKALPIILPSVPKVTAGFTQTGDYNILGDDYCIAYREDSLLVRLTGGSILFSDEGIATQIGCMNHLIQPTGTTYTWITGDTGIVYFNKQGKDGTWTGCSNTYPDGQRPVTIDPTVYTPADFLYSEVNTAEQVTYSVLDKFTFTLTKDGVPTATLGNSSVTMSAEEVSIKAPKITLESNNISLDSATVLLNNSSMDIRTVVKDCLAALSSMYTLGSPGTHNPDPSFKSKIAQLRTGLA